jgi:hypothetical protein
MDGWLKSTSSWLNQTISDVNVQLNSPKQEPPKESTPKEKKSFDITNLSDEFFAQEIPVYEDEPTQPENIEEEKETKIEPSLPPQVEEITQTVETVPEVPENKQENESNSEKEVSETPIVENPVSKILKQKLEE